MFNDIRVQIIVVLLTTGLLGFVSFPAAAAVRIEGQVQAGGGPLARSEVTLWGASAGEPKQLAQTRTRADGQFELRAKETSDKDVVLYLIAKGGEPSVGKGGGDNPAIVFLAVLGGKPPARVVVNEFTTVASVWTHAQFLGGTAIKGHALGLRIAAGNVPNFVDLATGGWGDVIQDPLNSSQTPTMANFATLANVLAGCATRVSADVCGKLFTAAAPATGSAPTDTLTAAEAIARYPWYKPGEALRVAGLVLSDGEGQDDASHALQPVSLLCAERMGTASQVRRRRLSRGREGHVRQRGQPLGRR